MQIKINGTSYEADPTQNILRIALDNGIDIPHFCYHEDLEVEANCRTCLVEIVGVHEKSRLRVGEIVTSCTLKPEEGLEISTDTEGVKSLRKTNLELLLSHHQFSCNECPRGSLCQVTNTVKDEQIAEEKYACALPEKPIFKMGTAAELESNKCVACNQCVKICEEIGIGFLKLSGKGVNHRVDITDDEKIDCIYCGQCTVHCPVAAVREQSHLEEVEQILKDDTKTIIVQMAPSVRVSIGESFGFPIGTNLEKKLNTAFREIGFDKVFDVNWGADITTMVEAEELVNRIKEKQILPMFTSCCPGWVKFVEFYYPEMIPHLTTSRSPQIHSGGAFKTWWAQKAGLDPKNIVVVSIMPCTSKKYESNHEKLLINGLKPVDYVLTSRETATLLKNHSINLHETKESAADELGEYSGAAAIYGASGGVMESALRTAAHMITGKELDSIEFEQVRGMDGIKKATIEIGDLRVKVAVVATPKNARLILEEIKKDPKAYDYIEFMACPGGCIGGGGQPIPSTKRIVAQRAKGLYAIDDAKQNRLAHKNQSVLDFLEYCKGQGHEFSHQLLHTSYAQKKRFE